MHDLNSTALGEIITTLENKIELLEWQQKYKNLDVQIDKAIELGKINILNVFCPASSKFDNYTLWNFIKNALIYHQIGVADWFLNKARENNCKFPLVEYDSCYHAVYFLLKDKLLTDSNYKREMEFLISSNLIASDYLETLALEVYIAQKDFYSFEQDRYGFFLPNKLPKWMLNATMRKDNLPKFLKLVSSSNMAIVNWFFRFCCLKFSEDALTYSPSDDVVRIHCHCVEMKDVLLDCLRNAIKTKDLEMVQFFNVPTKQFDSGLTSEYGWKTSLLDIAVKTRNVELVEWVAANRPNDKYGCTIRSLNATNNLEMFKWICENQLTSIISSEVMDSDIQASLKNKKVVLL